MGYRNTGFKEIKGCKMDNDLFKKDDSAGLGDKILRPPSVVFLKAGGWTLAGMMVLTAADVFLRAVFNSPITGAIDITVCLMPILTISGLAFVSITRTHINADILVRKLSPRTQKVIETITTFLSFVFCLLVSWQSFLNMKAVSDQGVTTGVLPIPVYPFVGLVGVGMLLVTVALLKDFFALIREIKK